MRRGASTSTLLLVLLALGVTRSTGAKSYEGDVVVRVVPGREMDLKFLQNLYLASNDFDVWNNPALLHHPVLIRLPANSAHAMLEILRLEGLDPVVTIPNLGDHIRNEKRNTKDSGVMWSGWTAYEEYDAIIQFVQDLAAAVPFVDVTTLGLTYEGRDIWLVRINKDNGGAPKKSVFFDFNIHAREWVTSAVATWFINEMITNPAYERILNEWDFHIIPVANPDGFIYSQLEDRLWRKTRTDWGSIFGCRGVDPNRNWDMDFGGPGTSSDKCSDLYHGPNAFSEPSTRAISDYIVDMGGGDFWDIFFSMHSFSQMILFPWGYTDVRPPDYDRLYALAKDAEDVIEGIYGTQYVSGTIAEVIYKAAGSTADWAKGALGIDLAFAFELRDDGDYGFLLPPEQIIPCAEETWQGIISFLDNVSKESKA